MSRADDIAAATQRIRARLADGQWRDAIDLTPAGDPWQTTYDALSALLRDEVIEMDTRRRVYRLVPTAARQLSLGEEVS